jgi:hypothetical protein
MWACVFSTAYFARSGAGFESQWRLIEVVPGRAGSYRLDRGGSLAGGAPAAQGTPVSENVTFPEDPYRVQRVFRSGTGSTDRVGVFADVYAFDYRDVLPGDFRLVMEQTYAVRGEPVCDAIRLAAAGRVSGRPTEALHLRNRVTYEADHPEFKVLLHTADGRGGWRLLWSNHSNRIRVEAPPRPSLPPIDRPR